MTNEESARLLELLEVGGAAVGEFTALAREVDESELSAPTDCPGWNVHDAIAHTAHLEAVLAGAPEETVPVPEGLSHVVGLMNVYTEQGVIARRGRTRDELVAEIESSWAQRNAETRADPPSDPAGQPPRTPGGIGWNWGTLLNNRPVDLFSHEQDIRRAVGRPGNLDTPVARHVVEVFAGGLGFVLGKKAGAPSGTTALVELTDAPADWSASYGVRVGEDGRGRPWRPDVTPEVTLRMTTDAFVVLCGGRRPADAVAVEVEGDAELGARILAGMSMTP